MGVKVSGLSWRSDGGVGGGVGDCDRGGGMGGADGSITGPGLLCLFLAFWAGLLDVGVRVSPSLSSLSLKNLLAPLKFTRA